jgi:hypothetical protein
MACTNCLVCLISTVNGYSKKKKEKKPIKTGASSGHITNLKQSILETFDIYDFCYLCCVAQGNQGKGKSCVTLACSITKKLFNVNSAF